jgi:hypothetical protein
MKNMINAFNSWQREDIERSRAERREREKLIRYLVLH